MNNMMCGGTDHTVIKRHTHTRGGGERRVDCIVIFAINITKKCKEAVRLLSEIVTGAEGITGV